jgi:hypothetical protein
MKLAGLLSWSQVPAVAPCSGPTTFILFLHDPFLV